MIYKNVNYEVGELPIQEKIRIIFKTLSNPFKIILDKFGVSKYFIYQTKNGIKVKTRSKTSDVNEVVVVLSGKEYPKELLNIDHIDQPVVIDAGGHIGTFALYLKKLNPTAKIIVFEPFNENLDLIRENLELNGINDVTLVGKALYSSAGEYFLDISKKDYDGGFLVKDAVPGNRIFRIQTTTLENFAKENNISHIDLLKMDIEGSEFEVVEHSLNFLKEKINRIVLEYHKNYKPDARDYVVKRLVGVGFNLIFETKNILGFSK